MQTSAALHAHPRPLWHVFLRLMQLLPQAWPASQTEQHLSAGMHVGAPASPVGALGAMTLNQTAAATMPSLTTS